MSSSMRRQTDEARPPRPIDRQQRSHGSSPCLGRRSPLTYQVSAMKAAKDAISTLGMGPDPFVFAT